MRQENTQRMMSTVIKMSKILLRMKIILIQILFIVNFHYLISSVDLGYFAIFDIDPILSQIRESIK